MKIQAAPVPERIRSLTLPPNVTSLLSNSTMRKKVSRDDVRLISSLMSALLTLLLTNAVLAQTPTPDKRDLVIQTNQQANSQANQTNSKQSKPELVLQTG